MSRKHYQAIAVALRNIQDKATRQAVIANYCPCSSATMPDSIAGDSLKRATARSRHRFFNNPNVYTGLPSGGPSFFSTC